MIIDPDAPIGLRPVSEEWPIGSKFGEKRSNALIKKLGLVTPDHAGVDFSCPVGTPIKAYRGGKVIIAHDNGDGFGLRLWIEHGKFMDGYCHLSEFFVTPGAIVKQGDTIALSGSTGKVSGPHLHFEVRIAALKMPVCPFFYDKVA